jgi:hypothetical protein
MNTIRIIPLVLFLRSIKKDVPGFRRKIPYEEIVMFTLFF